MEQKRVGSIELFRFIVAVLIALRHINRIFPRETFGALFSRGALGVEFFFITSGYLMAVSAQKVNRDSETVGHATTRFILGKYKRLMPEYLIAMGFSFVFFCIRSRTIHIKEIVTSLLTWLWELVPLSMAGYNKGLEHMGAWYISAMLLSMFILFPLCVWKFDTFVRFVAPNLAIWLLGFLHMSYNSLLGPMITIGGGVMYKGIIRGLGEIALGAALYPCVQWLQRLQLTSLGKKCMSVAVWALGGGIIRWIAVGQEQTYDVFCAAAIALLTLLLFSKQSYFAEKLDTPICFRLGRKSMLLYLCHVELARLMVYVYKSILLIYPHPLRLCAITLCMYMAGIALTMFLVERISNAIRRNGERLLSRFVAKPI